MGIKFGKERYTSRLDGKKRIHRAVQARLAVAAAATRSCGAQLDWVVVSYLGGAAAAAGRRAGIHEK